MIKKSLIWAGKGIYKLLSIAWGLPFTHTIMFIGLIMLSYLLFGSWGIIGLILAEIFVALIIVLLRWRIYIDGIRHLESLMWGRPLDRKYRHLPRKRLSWKSFKPFSKKSLYENEEDKKK